MEGYDDWYPDGSPAGYDRISCDEWFDLAVAGVEEIEFSFWKRKLPGYLRGEKRLVLYTFTKEGPPRIEFLESGEVLKGYIKKHALRRLLEKIDG